MVGAYQKYKEELQDDLNRVFSEYKEAWKNSEVWRLDFLCDLAHHRAEHFGLPYKTELRQLQHQNQQHVATILQQAGVFDVDKMHTITLMNTEFNMTININTKYYDLTTLRRALGVPNCKRPSLINELAICECVDMNG